MRDSRSAAMNAIMKRHLSLAADLSAKTRLSFSTIKNALQLASDASSVIAVAAPIEIPVAVDGSQTLPKRFADWNESDREPAARPP